MNLKQIRKSRWFKFGTNIYVLVSAFLLLDVIFRHQFFSDFMELGVKINDLERQKEELIRQIQDDRKFIKKLSDSTELEKFGRENYYLKKVDEDIFIIEFRDSLDTSS